MALRRPGKKKKRKVGGNLILSAMSLLHGGLFEAQLLGGRQPVVLINSLGDSMTGRIMIFLIHNINHE